MAPGFDFASAISSGTLFAPRLGWATRIHELFSIRLTGAKPPTGLGSPAIFSPMLKCR